MSYLPMTFVPVRFFPVSSISLDSESRIKQIAAEQEKKRQQYQIRNKMTEA